MPEFTDDTYSLHTLKGYSLIERMQIRLAGFAFYILIKLVGLTIRFEVSEAPRTAENGPPPIYAVWHDRIFLGTYFLQGRGIVFLTSLSFDGEYIARFLHRFGFGVIRGSSTRGGARGLARMIRGVKRGLAMGFTVDGPKGPRYVVKPGPILLAKKTGSPIVPFLIEPARYWTLNSWDHLQIPMPFARAKVFYGEPIKVGSQSGIEEMEATLAELQKRMDDLVKRGADWRRAPHF